jgi:imidazolonepropionase-like amidohydrolase
MLQLMHVGLLIDGTDRKPVADVTLVVEDGLIVEIARGEIRRRGATIRRYERKVVMPGLVDSHAHLELTPGPDHESGIRTHAADEAAGLTQIRALTHAQLALTGGITTIQDCGSSLGLTAVRDAIAGGVTGPRLLVSGPAITTTAGHGHWLGTRADSELEVRKATRSLIERGVDVIKIVASGGNATAGSNPLSPQYSVAELSAAVTEAHRLGRRVVAHALNAEAIRRCVDAGVDVIDHCWWQQPDGSDGFDPAYAKRIVTSDTTVGLTGSGILRTQLDQGEAGVFELRQRLASHRMMLDAGIRLTVHSDAGGRFTDFERFDRSLEVMVVGLDVPPETAITAATKHAAEGMGIAADVGTLEVSKQADMLVLNRNPLENIAHLRAIHQVIRGGSVVVDRGRLRPPGKTSAQRGSDRIR